MENIKKISIKNKNISKQLILQKINLNKYEDMRNHLSKIFSDPNYYFNNNYKGQRIIIGKNISKNIISKRFSHRKSLLRMKNINRQSQSLSKTESKKTMPKLNINFNQNNNRRIIEHDELKNIYNRFKEINEGNFREKENKNQNIKSRNCIDSVLTEEISDTLNKTIKTEIEHELIFQNSVLLKRKKEDIKLNKLSKSLSKKLKRPISKLLMKQNEEYRTIKEIKDSYYNEIQNSFPQQNFKWIVNLRDNDNHYINEGNEKFPVWNLYINKTIPKQIIRNPNLCIKTQNSFFKRNDYIKSKISHKKFSSLNKNMSQTLSVFNELYVKGKNLLNLEIENSKFLKGRKIVLNENTINNNNIKNEIYQYNIDYKYIKKKKRTFSLMDDDFQNFVEKKYKF